MKKVISLLLLLGLLVGTTVVFSSCDKVTEPIGGGAQISVYLGDKITDFDPQANQTDEAALSLIRLIFEPLFSVGKNGELLLAGAKNYKINKSEGKVTINLRESYWNDGATLVRASDYVYAWKRLIRSNSDNPAAALLYDVKNALKIKQGYEQLDNLGVEAVDNDTLEITFEDGFTSYELFLYNLANVALSPLNEKLLNNRGSYWGMSVSTISSNGPFRVTAFDTVNEGSFWLDRNRFYHRPSGSSAALDAFVIPAALKTIWNIIPSDDDVEEGAIVLTDDEYLANLIDGLAAKTVFYIGEIPQQLREEKKSSAVVTDSLSTYSYLFNCANPLFANAKVRRILSDVLDREYIASLAVYGIPATGLIPKTVNEGTKANAWTAKTPLSTSATLPVGTARTKLNEIEGYAPGEFKLTYKDNIVNQLIAEYVQRVWQDLGYTVTLEPVTVKAREETENELPLIVYDDVVQMKFETGDYDVLVLDYQMYSVNALPVLSTFTTQMNGGGMYISEFYNPADAKKWDNLKNNETQPTYSLLGNRMNYVCEKENEEDELGKFDAKMAAAFAEKDPVKRDVLLHEAEEILLSEMPIIPLLFNQRAYLVSDELSGITVDRYGFVSFTECQQNEYEKYLKPTDTLAPATTEEPAVTEAPATTSAPETTEKPVADEEAN